MLKYSTNDIEILVATMHRTSLDFLYNMFPNQDLETLNLVVVNQTSEAQKLSVLIPNCKVINVFEKGLSKSRNLAISNAKKPILLLADDDVVYQKDFLNLIVDAFNKNDDLDGVCFQLIDSQSKLFRKYPHKSKKQLTTFNFLNTMSVEIAFKNKINCTFDQNFGLGSHFQLGEETIWLFDCHKEGLKFGFEPAVILKHETLTTTSKVPLEKRYSYQSAVYYRIFGSSFIFWIILKIFFDIKQRQIKLIQIPKLFLEAIKAKKYYEKHCK